MPCWELFEQQPAGVPRRGAAAGRARALSVEPGVALGWERWVGDRGDSIALDRFGASAPGPTVLEQLGFNADNVVARATALLERVAMKVAVAFDHRGVGLERPCSRRSPGTT